MLRDFLLKRLCRADSASKSKVIRRIRPKNSNVFTRALNCFDGVPDRFEPARRKTKNPPFLPTFDFFSI